MSIISRSHDIFPRLQTLCRIPLVHRSSHARHLSNWTKQVMELDLRERDLCPGSFIQLFDENVQGLFELGDRKDVIKPVRTKPTITLQPYDETTRPIGPCRHFMLFPPRILVFQIDARNEIWLRMAMTRSGRRQNHIYTACGLQGVLYGVATRY
jgi:hypothetical protein